MRRRIEGCRRRIIARPWDALLSSTAAKLADCGKWIGKHQCPSHGTWAATHQCRHALCAPCSAKRRTRFLRNYTEAVTCYTNRTGEARAVMLTLTQQTLPGESFRAGVSRLRRAHGKLTRRLRKECPGIGGLTSYEATARPGETWHVHAHILLALPAELPNGWGHPDEGGGFRPLNPWRVRWAWAIAHLDLRLAVNKRRSAELADFADRASALWADKFSGAAGAKAAEAVALVEWAARCSALSLPAVLDVRSVPPAEALKYSTKGTVQTDPCEWSCSKCEYRGRPDWKRGEGGGPLCPGRPLRGACGEKMDPGPNLFTDWHVLDLVRSMVGARRTDAWGSLYHLQARIAADDDADESAQQLAYGEECPGCHQPHLPEHGGRKCEHCRPCPCCRALSPPVSGGVAVQDWLMVARARDRIRPLA